MTKMWVNTCGNLRTEAIHLSSGSKLNTDAPVDNRGKGETFSPTDLLSASLASCMLTIMEMKANDLGIDLGDVTLNVEKIMLSNPRRVGEIKINFVWNPKKFSEDHLKELKNAGLNCPVFLSLHPELKKTINFGD